MGTPIAPADNLQIQLEYLFGAAMPEIKEGISRYPERHVNTKNAHLGNESNCLPLFSQWDYSTK